ncbi:MAG: hypothetical protein ABII82_00445 [Verrucomicrobiota bacterium]
MEQNQALALISALVAARTAEVAILVARDAGGTIAGRIVPPGRLPREHLPAIGASKPELWRLLAPPSDEERRRCAEAAAGTATMRRAYPVTFPFSVTATGGTRGRTDEVASRAYGDLAYALGWQDCLRGEREGHAAQHGRDVYAARAWGFVNEHLAGGRWAVDEWGLCCVAEGAQAGDQAADGRVA